MSGVRRSGRQPNDEYELAKVGLDKVTVLTIIIFVFALLILLIAYLAFINRGEGFLSGYQLVIIIVSLVSLLIIIFALIYGRSTRMELGAKDAEKHVKFSLGDSVRNKSNSK